MTRTTHLRLFAALILAGVLFAPSARVTAQAPQATASTTCSLTWVGNEAAVEESLRTAPVLKLEDVPIGVTKPRRAVFAPGGLVRRAAWKPLSPAYRQGYHESYKAEIAAYALDRLLDLHMVPPVVERKVDGLTGAIVLWIENIHPWDMKKPPTGPEPGWSHQVSRMKMFDQLVANIDRNAGNLLYDDDWHLFLIDHSRAFTEKKDLKGLAAPGRVDRVLWDRITALTADGLQTALGQWLNRKEIAAIIARRDRMRDEINKQVTARGEASVFF